MLGLYLGALAFGGLLIGVSILMGGGDADFDKDVDFGADVDADIDLDVDADADVDLDKSFDLGELGNSGDAGEAATAAIWLPFLSMRFWTFGSMSFGMAGSLLHFLTPWGLTLGVASGTGLAVGTGAAWFFRQLRRNTITGSTQLSRYIGAEVRVLLPVYPDGLGKIVIDAPEGQLELVARTGDAQPIPRGSRALITEVVDGTANITGLPSLTDRQHTAQQSARSERTPE